MTLKPGKTELGFPSVKMLGYSVDGLRRSVHEDNLRPVHDMNPPTNKSELRSVLGLCLQARDQIHNYATRTRPLSKLTGNVPWVWDKTAQDAFIWLKGAVLQNKWLATPDFSKRFHIDTDASDVGMGAVLYQLVHDWRPTDPPAPDYDKKVVRYISAAHNNAMLKRPVYYKEARAVVWALSKFRYHLDHSPLETFVHSDHAPLRWIKTTRKGPVSAWLIEEIGGLQFRVFYVPGKDNGIADALSRVPVISPSYPNSEGRMRMWRDVLGHMPPTAASSTRFWVWANIHQDKVLPMVRQWRTTRTPILTHSPKTPPSPYHYAIVEPTVETGPVVCAKLFHKGKPFACLVAADLVSWIPKGVTSEVDKSIARDLAASAKIVYLEANLVWIIHNIPSVPDEVFSSQISLDKDRFTAWVEAQEMEKKQYQGVFGRSLLQQKSGLFMVAGPGERAKVVVPTSERRPLVATTHEQLVHAGAARTFKVLSNTYIWPTMRKNVTDWVTICTECTAAKAKLSAAHRQYSPTSML